MSTETSRLIQGRNAFNTEPADALALKRIMRRAQQNLLEEEGQASASEQDACLLHEDDSDQSMSSFSSPTDGGGDDLENLEASSSLQVWFDMEALGAHVRDNLDAIATTVQHLRTAFRSDVQIEPPEEVPDNSE